MEIQSWQQSQHCQLCMFVKNSNVTISSDFLRGKIRCFGQAGKVYVNLHNLYSWLI